jgi:hypothetical protein
MRQRRDARPPGRLTIGDLADAYDRGIAGKPSAVARRSPASVPAPRPAPSPRPVRALTVDQGDVRLARLRARADGIRFALQYENQTAAKAKLLRQTLQNLELAIRGMELTSRGS